MNTLVAYFSKFGNTQKVAEAIAEALAGAGKARALSIDGLAASELEGADLVVGGSPTHYQNLPREVRSALDTLSRRALRDKLVAAFDTSLETWGPLMWMTAAHRLLPRLRRLGGAKVVRPETYLVVRGEAPESGERQDTLCEGELERARVWAASVLDRVRARAERAP